VCSVRRPAPSKEEAIRRSSVIIREASPSRRSSAAAKM
jgi:hypothetical protein